MKNELSRLQTFKFFWRFKYPQNLKINGRKKLSTQEFIESDKLYHGFDLSDIDDDGLIGLNTIRFPDFSCNWGRFSFPKDIRYRVNGKMTDGCYSFTVVAARYKNIATPVHDPIDDKKNPNYSHVEVRELFDGEDIFFEPPKNRKARSATGKSQRLEYRFNLRNNLAIEIEAT
jgi:hypothetical protein